MISAANNRPSEKNSIFACMAKKVDYLIALINEFGKRYSLSDKDAYLYLKRYGAMSIYEDCYEYLHTQSFETAAEELAGFCRRNGGTLS